MVIQDQNKNKQIFWNQMLKGLWLVGNQQILAMLKHLQIIRYHPWETKR